MDHRPKRIHAVLRWKPEQLHQSFITYSEFLSTIYVTTRISGLLYEVTAFCGRHSEPSCLQECGLIFEVRPNKSLIFLLGHFPQKDH